ncbi:sulfatase-like hydrolase/transferase [Salipiger thiooxidans]|uniref:sulfatase-like hydrolase/transferase n=1 Tax=Salipiger thiooxidans TaxID=282683 RepID=UPI000A77E0D3|nr:sulfatase-like hydrolase/transferase [Salipiger thiooxidans]
MTLCTGTSSPPRPICTSAYYFANVEMIDREVGRILVALERRGRPDNRVVIFTSDHGDTLGDHGLSQKWAPCEQVTRVPMMISQPGRLPARRFDGLVHLFVLGPTRARPTTSGTCPRRCRSRPRCLPSSGGGTTRAPAARATSARG